MPRSVVNVYAHGKRDPGAAALSRLAAAGGFSLALDPRRPPVDERRASRILVQVLELAEALPFKRARQLDYPNLGERMSAGARR